MANGKKLYRTTDRMVGGVCGGLADYFGLDRSLVRIGMFLLFFAGTLSLWVYILLWIIMPDQSRVCR